MRFTLASLFFIISGFIFFILWAVTSLLISETHDSMLPFIEGMNQELLDMFTLLPMAFGIICAIFFVTGILLVFILDSLADEPEMYWRK